MDRQTDSVLRAAWSQLKTCSNLTFLGETYIQRQQHLCPTVWHVGQQGPHWFRKQVVICTAPNDYKSEPEPKLTYCLVTYCEFDLQEQFEQFFFFQENVFGNVVSNLYSLVCVFKNIWDHPSILFIGITVSVLRSLWFPIIQPENIVGHLITLWVCFNTLRPRHDGCHFTDNIFKYIILNENVWISTDILQKFIPKGLIDNTAALVQIMAWRRSGAMPLFEPMMTWFTDAYKHHSASMS